MSAITTTAMKPKNQYIRKRNKDIHIQLEMLNNIEKMDTDTVDEDEKMEEDFQLEDIDLSVKEPKINNLNINLGSDYSVRIGKVDVKRGTNEKDFQFLALLMSKKYKDENGSDKIFTFSMPIKLIPTLYSAIGLILDQDHNQI